MVASFPRDVTELAAASPMPASWRSPRTTNAQPTQT